MAFRQEFPWSGVFGVWDWSEVWCFSLISKQRLRFQPGLLDGALRARHQRHSGPQGTTSHPRLAGSSRRCGNKGSVVEAKAGAVHQRLPRL